MRGLPPKLPLFALAFLFIESGLYAFFASNTFANASNLY
jgi:hypothetical protein